METVELSWRSQRTDEATLWVKSQRNHGSILGQGSNLSLLPNDQIGSGTPFTSYLMGNGCSFRVPRGSAYKVSIFSIMNGNLKTLKN